MWGCSGLRELLGRLRPGGHSVYQWVMVALSNGTTAFAVWTFIMNAPQNGVRLMSDNQAVFWKSRYYSHKTLYFGNSSM